MHLLAAQKGQLAEPDEAIDLGQDPADVVFVSAADTELASLADAHDPSLGTLRLVNLTALAHPMSVDQWVERTAARSRLVVVRCLGGASYWPYGLERLLASGVPLVVLPGDDKPDASLDAFDRGPAALRERLWSYLIEGGPTNAAHFLRLAFAAAAGVADLDAAPPPARLPKAGVLDGYAAGGAEGERVVAITFYRALVTGGNLEPIHALANALRERGCHPLPVFVSSLKDTVTVDAVRTAFAHARPAVVINCTGFAASSGDGESGTVLDEDGRIVLQAVLAATGEATWRASLQGLGARDLAMNVALPEVDGRVLAGPIAFKSADEHDPRTQANIVRHRSVPELVDHAADLALGWARLRTKESGTRAVAMVLANYPNRDGRIGNGVGLDTPAGAMEVLRAMAEAGYPVADLPADGDGLLRHLSDGVTNAGTVGRTVRETMTVGEYRRHFDALPESLREGIRSRWGAPEADPFVHEGRFALPLARFGGTFVGIQPARGYNVDPAETYHDPDLVPPHGYLAFYFFLRHAVGVDAVIHMGKHGNLEWLPGKALGLSRACLPQAILGATPNIYPFIVNDPGEGTQAKRRNGAVIVDHLTPPLTRAEAHGPMKELEALVDEYYEAAGMDPRRVDLLRREIFDLMARTGLDRDAGIAGDDGDEALQRLDAWLCELKEMQIRDGLHVFGVSPTGRLRTDLVTALARVPRGTGEGADASLQRAIADDLLGAGAFDPLGCDMGAPWRAERPAVLRDVSDEPWRTAGDTVERIELVAHAMVADEVAPEPSWTATAAVLGEIRSRLAPAVDACGPAEIEGILTALDGRFLKPGPSGAPTRGRPEVLPTGRNFHSVDSRAVPTPAAWELGRRSADLLLTRHRQEHGEWPARMALSAWGTSNMRTGGDDIAQGLALLGVRPVWDHGSRRVTGFETITLAELGRPRVDVTLRVSGFFRDAFPAQIALFDKAVRAVAALQEDEADNPLAAAVSRESETLVQSGIGSPEAQRRASYRVFGSKPGAYGAGLQALIDEKGWTERADLAAAYRAWSCFAYGADEEGVRDEQAFDTRLAGVQAVVHNQDNREHDLLDSDDYYQFEGGLSAAVEQASGAAPAIWHNDHSRPERPVIRSLSEEIARVVRGRASNPKWIAGCMRHGYKGAFEMAATVDYLFAFAATTDAVADHHFDVLHAAYLEDDEVRAFLERHNPDALREMAARFLEAQERGLWRSRSNSARSLLDRLAA